ncbi:MAG: acylphosphatase [Lachnospiraceae bacterium]|nr:acylphosphatase [Lachnospiraceae bacterium]
MSTTQNIIRKRIRFTGTVQGVGFRYRATYAANGCGVTGWVRNEWDGSVLMEAQGTEQQINQVLKLINMGSYIYIDKLEYEEISVEENALGFHIR